jgi:uncharacterized protein YqeY
MFFRPGNCCSIFGFNFLSSLFQKIKIMSLQQDIMTAMKAAMKAKDQTALAALRAVKSEILLAKTSGAGDELSEADEIKLLQKLVKQRKDSAAIFLEQGRKDLALPEIDQAEVISQFLPEQLSEEEIEKVVVMTIDSVGATSMKDMGKVMGLVSKELAGQADGKTISSIVKAKLSN